MAHPHASCEAKMSRRCTEYDLHPASPLPARKPMDSGVACDFEVGAILRKRTTMVVNNRASDYVSGKLSLMRERPPLALIATATETETEIEKITTTNTNTNTTTQTITSTITTKTTTLETETETTEISETTKTTETSEKFALFPLGPYSFASAFWTSRTLPLYLFGQLPRYLQDNEFILSGYRSNYTYRQAWSSMFFVHNETGNIWTHLVALVLFLGLAVSLPTLLGIFAPFGSQYDAWDIFVFLLFAISACKCFAFSTLFHTHFCNSHNAFVCFGCLDYAGISLLICGSSVVVTYYIHYCNPLLRRVYLLLLAATAAVGIVGPMFKIWNTSQFRSGRTVIYSLSALLSAFPIAHYLYVSGLPKSLPFWAQYGWLIMGGFYLGGAAIYALKIPERWWPGRLDICGHSHQIWHLCVLFAALVHFWSSLELMFWRVATSCVVVNF